MGMYLMRQAKSGRRSTGVYIFFSPGAELPLVLVGHAAAFRLGDARWVVLVPGLLAHGFSAGLHIRPTRGSSRVYFPR